MIEIVSPSDVVPLRARVLRPGQVTEKSVYDKDGDIESLHLGFKCKNSIIGVCTFFLEGHEWLRATRPYRLRGMATDPSEQKKGIGRQMLLRAFSELKSRGCDLLWCNARENAFGFYEKMGFRSIGEPFEIDSIGRHKVMYKVLDSR